MTKLAFVFPGQGAQYVGMGEDLIRDYKVANELFEKSSYSLGYDMKKLCFQGPESELKKTENTQPAILTVSIAIYNILLHHGIKADVLAGLSLGEYTALVASKSITFQEAVGLVRSRGRYMQNEVPLGKGTMAAFIGLEKSKVIKACEMASHFGVVEPANYNSPTQIVISGEINAVEKAVEFGKELGAKKAVLLPVSAPFHSSMLKGAGVKLKKDLAQIKFNPLNIPIISNVTAEYYPSQNEIENLLIRQVSSPVLWEDSILKMINDGITTFIEVGPGKALSGFIKRISKEVTILNVEDSISIEKTLKSLT